jgi:hypothetical protein
VASSEVLVARVRLGDVWYFYFAGGMFISNVVLSAIVLYLVLSSSPRVCNTKELIFLG